MYPCREMALHFDRPEGEVFIQDLFSGRIGTASAEPDVDSQIPGRPESAFPFQFCPWP